MDGNLPTRWASAWSDPQWIYVDLGATYNITEVELYWETAYATSFQIQVSSRCRELDHRFTARPRDLAASRI